MKFIVSSRICWMAIAFAFSATASLAQGKPASGGEAGTKLAAINMRMAIANTAEGKQAASQLETEFMTRRKELEDLSKKINDLQQRLTSGASTLNDEEKERLTLEGQRLSRQLERRQNEFQEDLNDAQSEALSRIGRKMIEVLGKYAPKNGYGAVLDNSSQTTPVMYASTDITEDIVRLYDATYPAKGAAGAGNTNPSSKPTSKPVGE
ncbi:MAG TPA: OmpH family outer membrane protein [Candidatus Acidoferrum sp.]|nr:OmpH family outer membrane protein [Candidatus Acidoferrum sp.]